MTPVVRDTAGGSKNRTIAAAIRGLFRDAVKAVTSRDEEEQPPPRRRRGETEGDFRRLARKLSRRFDVWKQFQKVARKRVLRRQRTIILTPEAWGGTDAHLASTLDLQAQCHNDAGSDYGGGFDASPNHISPQL